MSSLHRTCWLVIALGAGCCLSSGCATSATTNAAQAVQRPTQDFHAVTVDQDDTRRGTELRYLLSPRYGVPRGLQFEDVIPVGARITAVNVMYEGEIKGIWLSYERAEREYESPRRGAPKGSVQAFRLGSKEKIVDLRAYGRPTITSLEIATNKRVVVLGGELPPGTDPWFSELTPEQMEQHVVVGLIGRADFSLRQLGVKIQVRGDE